MNPRGMNNEERGEKISAETECEETDDDAELAQQQTESHTGEETRAHSLDNQ